MYFLKPLLIILILLHFVQVLELNTELSPRGVHQLFNVLFGKKEMRIQMVELEKAGKTTFLYTFKQGESGTTAFTVWHVGGLDKIRVLLTHNFQSTQGLIFVVASKDRAREGEAREELMRMLVEDELRGAVLLLFADKQDLPNVMNGAEVADRLGLDILRNRYWYIKAICDTSGDGLYEGLKCLSNQLNNRA